MTDNIKNTDDFSELEAKYNALTKENKRLTRELNMQRDLNRRSQIIAQANLNLKKLLDEEKNKLERFMKLMLSNSTDMILLLDDQQRVVYISDSFSVLMGREMSQNMQGKTRAEITKKYEQNESFRQLSKLFDSAVGTKSQVTLERDLRLESGEVRHFIAQLMPMISGSGGIEAFMLILTDITALSNAIKDAEAARFVAEKSTQAKSEFLSRMSHEMRTPLNAIIGMASVAEKSDDPVRIKYSLGKMNEASYHLLGVINDVLDISKIESGKFELFRDDFDFEKMIQRVVNVNVFKLDEKKQHFNVRIDSDIPSTFYGDDQRLAQVVTNLLSNAIKFTDVGGYIRLEATLESANDANYNVRVDVSDNGIGLTAEQISRLFSSFEQADGSISRKYGGTGLGLSISKRIIELMDGRIWVESEPGKGSTFSFVVPLVKRVGRLREKLRSNVDMSNLRILVVDDSEFIRTYFSEIMAHFGIDCDVADSAETATKLINEKGDYDIYFVDWRMPGKNGIEVTREIKARNDCRSVVIMISSTELSMISLEANTAGIDGFLPKPIFPSAIMACINECLGVSGALLMSGKDKSQIQPSQYAGHRILLADDVEINREIVLTLLEPTLLEVDCCENGVQTVEMFNANPDLYDLIFMDIQMPEMDGYEATRQIRASSNIRGKNVPIIAMTANVFREDIDRCLATGMDDHIGKPLNFDEVMKVLKKFLPKR